MSKSLTTVQLDELRKGEGSFGSAIEAAKLGHKVSRIGWNGSGMYAYIVPANSYPAQTEVAKKQFGDMVPYRAYWALKTAQNDISTWAPSGSDSLAEDWMVLEDNVISEKQSEEVLSN